MHTSRISSGDSFKYDKLIYVRGYFVRNAKVGENLCECEIYQQLFIIWMNSKTRAVM